MEEDIEILESFIKQLEEFEDEEELKHALENLINRVKELEKEEKELEHLLTSQLGFNLYRDYIPKSKIKEKIEELENFEPEEYAPLVIKEEQLNNVKWQIQVLQELLEE